MALSNQNAQCSFMATTATIYKQVSLEMSTLAKGTLSLYQFNKH